MTRRTTRSRPAKGHKQYPNSYRSVAVRFTDDMFDLIEGVASHNRVSFAAVVRHMCKCAMTGKKAFQTAPQSQRS